MTRLTTFVTALALLLTPVVAKPAFADQKDLAKILFGVAAIAIIANEVKKNNDRKQTPVTRTHTPRHEAVGPCLRKRWTQQGWETYRDHDCVKRHKAKKKTHITKRKPKECLRQRWTDDGWQTFYSRRCLTRHGWTS